MLSPNRANHMLTIKDVTQLTNLTNQLDYFGFGAGLHDYDCFAALFW